MKIEDSFQKIFGDKDRVMVVTAHPDDNEIICGGIVARLLNEGKKVRLVVVTNGGKGFQDRKDITEQEFALIRVREQKNAGLKLGLTEDQNFNLGIADGEMENSIENIGLLVFHIRQFKPQLIITHNPFDPINKFNEEVSWVNHRDHRHTALTVLDAVYPYSRDRGFFPEHFKQGLEPHNIHEIMFSDSYSYKDVLYFDITKYMDKKKASLLEHKNALSPEDIEEEFLEETNMGEGKNYERLKHVVV